jgi:superfamily II DNA or RNA helicase
MLKSVLRPYQAEAVNRTIIGFEQEVQGEGGPYTKQLLVEPTGSGKTLLFAALTSYYRDVEKDRVLVLVDQTDLVDQTTAELLKHAEIYAQVEQGDRQASPDARVVATVQSLANRLHKFKPDAFQLVIADEADRSVAVQWQTVLSHFDGKAKVVGATATPDRNDQRSVLDYYERIAHETSMFDLIKGGYLSRVMVQTVPLKIDITKVHQSQGDYDKNELDDTLTPYFDEICEAIKQYASDRKILVFLPLIKTSEKFADVAGAHGIRAQHVDGKSADRDMIKQAFRLGNTQLLSNAMLLGRGYNDPSIDCVVNLRPTRSAPLYRQFVGRGTRTFCPRGCSERCDHDEAKKDLLLLDFLWQFERHGLIRPASLVARDKEHNDQLTDFTVQKAGQLFDLETIDSAVAAEMQKRLAETLAKQKAKKPGYFDAMEFAMEMGDRTLLEYEPRAKWEGKPLSDAQAAWLDRMGFNTDTIKGRGHASKIFDLARKRRDAGLATFKQVKLLRKFGVQSPELVGFADATTYIDSRINNIRLPQDFQLYRASGISSAPVSAETAVGGWIGGEAREDTTTVTNGGTQSAKQDSRGGRELLDTPARVAEKSGGANAHSRASTIESDNAGFGRSDAPAQLLLSDDEIARLPTAHERGLAHLRRAKAMIAATE